MAFILAEIEIRCLEGESGSLEQQYDCSVKEIPGVDSTLTNTSLLEYKKFCSAGDSAAKREILINYCSAYKVVDKLQKVSRILLQNKVFIDFDFFDIFCTLVNNRFNSVNADTYANVPIL